MKKIVVLMLIIGLVGVASAVTEDDMEAAVEAASGMTGTTFLEFTNGTVGREGLSITDGASDWGYPDGSSAGMFVNDDGLDDKGNACSDFEFTISGLTANVDYQIYYIAKTSASGSGKGDFSWGLGSDGAAVNQAGPYLDALPGATALIGLAGNDSAVGVPVAIVTADAMGMITMYGGNGLDFNGDEFTRTQMDGVVIGTIPEPMTLSLLGLGSLILIRKKR